MNQWALVAFACVVACVASAQDAGSIEIRFCPAAQVRAFEQEPVRGVQGLLLQNALIVNRGAVPVELTELAIELLGDGRALDERRFAGPDLARIAASGQGLQASGMMKLMSFQFCGQAVLTEGMQLTGPTLAPGQALLLAQQPFSWKGKRDALRLRVRALAGGREREAQAELPVRSGFASARLAFPLRGTWFAAVGPTLHTAHRWALPEEFGYDIVRLGAGDLTHRGSGTRFSDFFAYGADVRAAGEGVVVAAMGDAPEDAAALRRPGENAEAYLGRLQQAQMALLSKGAAAVAGNHVVIDHGNGEFSLYAHLQPKSVAVRVGQHVATGTVLGKLGSSGNSTEPHLHFQVCDSPDPLLCAGVPVNFVGVTLPLSDYPRAVQSGDVVVAD